MWPISGTNKPHAVCIPLPFQSHINAMLKFAKVLYFKGFHITFVHTEFNHQKVLKSRGLESLEGFPDFRFETIPDGLPPCDIEATQDMEALYKSSQNNFLTPFCNLITKLNQESDTPRVTCIITDGAMTSLLPAAEEIGIPGVLLWTMSAAFMMSNLHCPHLREKGLIPLKDDCDLPMDLIPGMRDIRRKDLPSPYFDYNDLVDTGMYGHLLRFPKASAIIINTFHPLESEVLEALAPLLPTIYTIGPLQLLLQETSNNKLNSLASNLREEDHECIKWLDLKKPHSVVYVNFGSHTSMTREQFIELAWGLANCKYPFLWVIRPDFVIGSPTIFPVEFNEKTVDRGMISNWCPQEQVLSHSAIGAFLTHSGWNSTIDTICGGVPVISKPFFGDQSTNRGYACVQWGIGMEIDDEVKRDEIERVVREMMEGEKGKTIKGKAMEWKRIAEESTIPGGSSYLNLDKLIKEVLIQNKRV